MVDFNVINLLSRLLNKVEKNLFLKGLKFLIILMLNGNYF